MNIPRKKGQSAMGFSLRKKLSLCRGQSAMEFLMTYGWAILIMLVVIAVLFYVGVLNPRNVAPNSLTLPAGFSAYDYAINENGYLVLDLGQGTGSSITVTQIACTTEDATSGVPVNARIQSGKHAMVATGSNIPCQGAEDGVYYKGYVHIWYTTYGSSIPHKITGDIGYRVGGQATGSGGYTPVATNTPSQTGDPNGSACNDSSTCQSGYCNNGCCCASGTCCNPALGIDCPPGYTCNTQTFQCESTGCIYSSDPPCNCNGECNLMENFTSCPWDCPEEVSCNNNGVCEPGDGETTDNCPHDCHLLLIEGMLDPDGYWLVDSTYLYALSEIDGKIYKVRLNENQSCNAALGECTVIADLGPTSASGTNIIGGRFISHSFTDIYYADNDNEALHKIPVNGAAMTSFTGVEVSSVFAVDNNYAYSPDFNGELTRISTSSGAQEMIANLSEEIPNHKQIEAIELLGNRLYFMSMDPTQTYCTLYMTDSLNPGTAVTKVADAYQSPESDDCGLTQYNNKLYWTQQDGVYRVNAGSTCGSSCERIYNATPLRTWIGLDSFAGEIWWSDGMYMMKGPADPDPQEPPIIAITLTHYALSAGGIGPEYVYYANMLQGDNVYRFPRP